MVCGIQRYMIGGILRICMVGRILNIYIYMVGGILWIYGRWNTEYIYIYIW